jgi:hypothetical protein
VNDQFLPRAIIAALAVLFVYRFAEAPPKDTNVSPRRKIGLRPLVAAFVGVAGYLLASRVHWHPATDGSGTP